MQPCDCRDKAESKAGSRCIAASVESEKPLEDLIMRTDRDFPGPYHAHGAAGHWDSRTPAVRRSHLPGCNLDRIVDEVGDRFKQQITIAKQTSVTRQVQL